MQGSTYNSLTASRAVDGDLTTCSLSVSGVRSEELGWWQVDLGRTYNVSSVELINTIYGEVNNIIIHGTMPKNITLLCIFMRVMKW